MGKTSKRRRPSSPMRKLRATLTEMAATSRKASDKEGESYVCAVCQLPVRQCNADETKRCSNMLVAGTQLQVLRDRGRRRAIACIRCGGSIKRSVLNKDPFAELCSTCKKSSPKLKSSQRSKGVSR